MSLRPATRQILQAESRLDGWGNAKSQQCQSGYFVLFPEEQATSVFTGTFEFRQPSPKGVVESALLWRPSRGRRPTCGMGQRSRLKLQFRIANSARCRRVDWFDSITSSYSAFNSMQSIRARKGNKASRCELVSCRLAHKHGEDPYPPPSARKQPYSTESHLSDAVNQEPARYPRAMPCSVPLLSKPL